VPEGLKPQIDFWRNVYAVWSLNQVVLHDDEHLNLVYEVIDLPNIDGSEYSRAKRRFVQDRQEDLAFRLRTLENKVAVGIPLNTQEQALVKRITTLAGARAITGASTRLRSQRGLRERFKRGLEISGRYDGLFRDIFREAGLPEDIAYLPHVESSFQPHARSSAGAVGMWQFTRPAAKIYMRNHPALDERQTRQLGIGANLL
jgi:membrane-bound lytic murein transglycosylase D